MAVPTPYISWDFNDTLDSNETPNNPFVEKYVFSGTPKFIPGLVGSAFNKGESSHFAQDNITAVSSNRKYTLSCVFRISQSQLNQTFWHPGIKHILTLDWLSRGEPESREEQGVALCLLPWKLDNLVYTARYMLRAGCTPAVEYEDSNGNSGENVSPSATSLFRDFALDEWTHLVGTVDETTGTMILYVNGYEVSRAYVPPYSLKTSESTDPQTRLFLGGWDNTPDGTEGRTVNGDVDQVSLWDSVLTPEQVLEFYETYTGKVGVPPIESPSKRWEFDYDLGYDGEYSSTLYKTGGFMGSGEPSYENTGVTGRAALKTNGFQYATAVNLESSVMGEEASASFSVKFSEQDLQWLKDQGGRGTLVSNHAILEDSSGANQGFRISTIGDTGFSLEAGTLTNTAFTDSEGNESLGGYKIEARRDAPGGKILADTWYHISAVVSELTGKATLYLNGEEFVSVTGDSASPNIHNTPEASHIRLWIMGGSTDPALLAIDNPGTGTIDDLRLYSKALSSEQIKAEQYINTPPEPVPPVIVNPPEPTEPPVLAPGEHRVTGALGTPLGNFNWWHKGI